MVNYPKRTPEERSHVNNPFRRKEQFRAGDKVPVHGLFWLRGDSIFDNLGVTAKGAKGCLIG